MDITWRMDDGEDDRRRLAEVTIKLVPEDDPHGYLVGLLWHKRLEAFLQIFAKPAEYGATGHDAAEFRDLLNRFGYVGYHVAMRLDGMMLAARDWFGIGWGTIATTVERPRQTVKDQIIANRKESARIGHWYDSAGLHEGTGTEASAAIDGRD